MATVKDFKKALNKLLSKLGEYADDTEYVVEKIGTDYYNHISSNLY